MSTNIYRILIVGPTGVGKSQLCNFALKDLSNSKNTVSDSLDSCTQDPKSNEFQRKEAKFDFIDTAGNNDSDDNDIVNLEKLVNYLKILKSIHYIILVLRFGERFTGDTKQYIETLGKIFTISEFFCHLCIVFTKFPNEPTDQDLKTKEKHKSEIIKSLTKIFNIKKEQISTSNDIYFIDTKIDEKTKNFNQKSQETIDIMLAQIKLNLKLFYPINTENLDITGKNAKVRREKEIEFFKQKMQEEKKAKELAQKEAENARKREEECRKEEERKRKAFEMANEQEKKKREEEYINFLKKQEEDRKRREIEKKKIEEEKKRNLEFKEQLRREQEKIDEEKRQKQIRTDKLNNVSNAGSGLVKMGGIGLLGSIGLGLLGAALTPFCPIAGPCLIGAAIGGSTAGTAEIAIGGTMYGIAEYKKG